MFGLISFVMRLVLWTIPWWIAMTSLLACLTLVLAPELQAVFTSYAIPLMRGQIESHSHAKDIPLLPERLGETTEAPGGSDSEAGAPGSPSSADAPRRLGAWVTVRRQWGPATRSIFAPKTVPHMAGARQSGSDLTEESYLASSYQRTATGSTSSFDVNGYAARDNQSVDNVSLASSTLVDNDDSASIASGNTLVNARNPALSTKAAPGGSPMPPQSKTLWQTARSALPWSKAPPPKERYYCVLKGSTIYIYEDDKQTDSAHAIAVDRFNVEIHTAAGRFKGRDGEMFNKKNAIVLRPMRPCDSSDEEHPDKPPMSKSASDSKDDLDEQDNEPWYLFFRNHSQMEDWYLALLRISLDKMRNDQVFDMNDMQSLIGTLDKEEDPIPTRWLIGFLGRIFFALHKTAFIEKFIMLKIERKLSKVPKQKFVKDVAVREVNLGTFPPIFSKPMLKEASPDGHVSFETHVRYIARDDQPNSAAHLTFAAVVSPGFGSTVVNVVACAKIKRIEGNMIFQIKPAPSNRIWYGFVGEPTMDFDIIIMTGPVTVQGSSFITESIKSFLRKAMNEAIVSPNLDDLSFFDTQQMDIRGGIFNESSKLAASAREREEVIVKEGPSQPGVTMNPDVVPSTTSVAHNETNKTKGFFGGRRSPSPTKSKSNRKTPSPKASIITLPSLLKSAPAQEDNLLHKSATEPVLTAEPMKLTDSSKSVGRDRAPHPVDGLEIPDSNTAGASARPKTIHTDLVTSEGAEAGPSNSDPASSSPIGITRSSPTERPASLFSAFTRPKSGASHSPNTRSTSPSDSLHQRLSSETTRPDEARPTNGSLLSLARGGPGGLEARAMAGRTKITKWGVDSLAKGRAEFVKFRQGQAEAAKPPAAQAVSVPAPLYRPSSQDGPSHSGRLAHSPSQSLQERLSETVKNAAAPMEHGGRDRSTSNASASSGPARHALLSSSPSKADPVISAPSISEPELTLAATRSSDKPLPPVGDDDKQRPSFNATTPPAVQRQPSAGVGMTVPRVPKRAGQVTGLGSSPASSALLNASQRSSKTSTADTTPSTSVQSTPVDADPPSLPSRRPETSHPITTGFVPPPLPPRRSVEEPRPVQTHEAEATATATTKVREPATSATAPEMAMDRSISIDDSVVQTPAGPSTDDLLAPHIPPASHKDPSDGQNSLRTLTDQDVRVG